jgi:hypothetical protein
MNVRASEYFTTFEMASLCDIYLVFNDKLQLMPRIIVQCPVKVTDYFTVLI